MLDKSSNEVFTKGLAVVVVVVKGVVEELELGAETINGCSDTMKSNTRGKEMQNRENRVKK